MSTSAVFDSVVFALHWFHSVEYKTIHDQPRHLEVWNVNFGKYKIIHKNWWNAKKIAHWTTDIREGTKRDNAITSLTSGEAFTFLHTYFYTTDLM